MRMRRRPTFDKEFKLQVVRRSLNEHVSIKQLSHGFQIAARRLCRWRKEFLEVADSLSVFLGYAKQELSEQQQYIKQLQKQRITDSWRLIF